MLKSFHNIVVHACIIVAILSNSCIEPCSSSKILFFFGGGTYSHKVSIWPFVAALADRGHNVTFVSAFSKKPFEHSGINDVAPRPMEEAMSGQYTKDRLTQRLNYEEDTVWDNFLQDVFRVCKIVYSTIDKDPRMHNLFHHDTFDIMINNEIFGDCGLALAHKLVTNHGTKLILYNSAAPVPWYNDLFGFVPDSAWIPNGPRVRDFPMNFYERMENYFGYLYWYLARHYVLHRPLEKLVKEKVYPQLDSINPSLMDIQRNASLVFIATDFATDYATTRPPFFVNIGGMQCWQPRKPFQGEFKEFLDEAKNGAILIAFGSTIDLSKMPEFFKRTFFGMMTKFPDMQFIWRWDGPLPKDAPKNLKVSKWLPQFDILGHKNLKAFISHGGLNSLTEATYQGVPLIMLPLFADQDYNAYRVQAYEIGIRVEARTLTPESMENAVRDIFEDKKYAGNMKKISAIMRDKQMTPIETAVYWTEFVLRHEDTSSLKPLNQLNWFQRRMLDVFFLSAFLFTGLLMISICLLRLCYMRLYLRIYSTQTSRKIQNTDSSANGTKGKNRNNLKKQN